MCLLPICQCIYFSEAIKNRITLHLQVSWVSAQGIILGFTVWIFVHQSSYLNTFFETLIITKALGRENNIMKNKSSIRFIYTISRSFFFICTLAFLIACDTNNEPVATKTIPTVSVISADILTSYSVTRQFVGTVQASQRANLGFEFGGKIEAVFVDTGDNVKTGDPLIQLDTQLLVTEALLLSAQRDQLDAQIELVINNLERQRKLKEKGFSADAEIDSLTSQRDALLANIRQQKAALALNQLRKDKSTIFAPYSGTISQRFVSKGDVVNASTPTLTLLNSPNEAHVGLPVKYLSALKENPRLTLRIGDRFFETELINPSPSINARARTVTLRLSLPDDAKLINGQIAYLDYETKIPESGFWIPLTGLTDGLRGMWNVYVVVKNNDGKSVVARRSVQIVYTDENLAFVSGAIYQADNVVAEGVHRIVSGQQVNISAE